MYIHTYIVHCCFNSGIYFVPRKTKKYKYVILANTHFNCLIYYITIKYFHCWVYFCLDFVAYQIQRPSNWNPLNLGPSVYNFSMYALILFKIYKILATSGNPHMPMYPHIYCNNQDI